MIVKPNCIEEKESIKSERITTILTYDNSDTMFVSLTADQLRLLEWLRYNDCLCDGMTYLTLGSEKFEEI